MNRINILVNMILVLSLIIVSLSGVSLYFQIPLGTAAQMHRWAGLTLAISGIFHLVLKRKSFFTGLKGIPSLIIGISAIIIVAIPPFISGSTFHSDARSDKKIEDIILPSPVKSGGMPLLSALGERQSIRSYLDRDIDPQVLSNLLWAAFGINRPDSGKRTAPTAFDRQGVKIYVVMREGAYLYDPAGNRLEGIARGDHRATTGTQSFVETAPVNLVYVVEDVPTDGFSSFMTGADVGGISQNVYLFCASEGLGTVVRGWVNRDALPAALKLAPNDVIILAQSVGYPR